MVISFSLEARHSYYTSTKALTHVMHANQVRSEQRSTNQRNKVTVATHLPKMWFRFVFVAMVVTYIDTHARSHTTSNKLLNHGPRLTNQIAEVCAQESVLCT